MELIEEINLANGLILKIFDLSCRVAADTTKVEISFQTKIDLKESYFASPQDYAQVKNIMGDVLNYENKRVRSFVYISFIPKARLTVFNELPTITSFFPVVL